MTCGFVATVGMRRIYAVRGEVQGRGGEDELGTELHSQEFLISKSAMNQNFTPKFT